VAEKNNRGLIQLELPDPVARALTEFADITRRLMVWRAAGILCAFVLASFTLIACADRFINLEEFTRRWLALLAYGTLFGLGYALLRRALRRQDPGEVAATLEKQAPQADFQERLSTTVEIAKRRGTPDADQPDQPGALPDENVSEAMIEWVADEAAELVDDLDVSSLADQRPMRKALILAASLFFVVSVLMFLPRLQMPTMYVRAFFPWMNLQRPSNTHIDVLTGNQRVVEGESLDVEAHISGVPAESVYVETREKNEKWQRFLMDTDRSQNSRFSLKLGPLHAPVEYRVTANDGQSERYGIAVLPRPEVAGLKITVHFPNYTKLPDQIQEGLNGDIAVLKGSRVELSLKSNTPLSAAVLEFENDRRLSMTVNDKEAAAGFEIKQNSTYRVRLRSIDEVSNPDAPLFSIRAIPDMPPQVTVMSPNVDEAIDAGSVISLEARAEDDLAVTGMRIVARSAQRSNPITIPLRKPEGAGKVWLVSQPWDLAGLFLDNDELVTYRVEASDALGNVGRSDERRLRV